MRTCRPEPFLSQYSLSQSIPFPSSNSPSYSCQQVSLTTGLSNVQLSLSLLAKMEGHSLSPNFSSGISGPFASSHKSYWSQIIQTRVEIGVAEVCSSDVWTDFENEFPSGIQRAAPPAWRWGVREGLAWAGSPSSKTPGFRESPYWRISLTFSKGQVK